MILNDEQIEALALAGNLSPFDRDETTASGYLLHASRAFWPSTGEERYVDRPTGIVWRVEPGQTIVVKTRERVRLPGDVAASCSGLHRLAEHGVTLLDGGIVEPLYDGPLSVTLINFSRQTVLISPLDPVARLTFMRLAAPATWATPHVADDDSYDVRLAKTAARRPPTLAAPGGNAGVPRRGERVARFAIPAAVALAIALAAEPFVARAVTSAQPAYAAQSDVTGLRDEVNRRGVELDRLRAKIAYDEGVLRRVAMRRTHR